MTKKLVKTIQKRGLGGSGNLMLHTRVHCMNPWKKM